MEDLPETLLIPPQIQSDLNRSGVMPSSKDDVRIAPRYRCCGPGVLEWVDSPSGLMLQFPMTQVVVRNLSRTGFSVLADRQWFPEQTARLYLPIATVIATVVRARRLGSFCYDLGLRLVHYRQIN